MSLSNLEDSIFDEPEPPPPPPQLVPDEADYT